jgi:hypothetical protein
VCYPSSSPHTKKLWSTCRTENSTIVGIAGRGTLCGHPFHVFQTGIVFNINMCDTFAPGTMISFGNLDYRHGSTQRSTSTRSWAERSGGATSPSHPLCMSGGCRGCRCTSTLMPTSRSTECQAASPAAQQVSPFHSISPATPSLPCSYTEFPTDSGGCNLGVLILFHDFGQENTWALAREKFIGDKISINPIIPFIAEVR